MMTALTVLYDGSCALCLRCRDFLAEHASYVPIELLSCQSADARARFGAVPWLGEELVVVSNDGDVWVGPAAFIMCLWALVDYRDWSYRLSGPELVPLAARFFQALSSRRRSVARFFGPTRCEEGAFCTVSSLAPDHGSEHRPRQAYR